MQKHKKWLVITIWISTISFIAAGMVGWGSYSFHLNEGIVAKVGNLNITERQLQNRYRQLYAQYDTDGQMDAQKAQELGLEDIAFKSLIEQALLQNLALDLGLRITHKEITDEISNLSYFQKEGKFDASLYKGLLKQNGIKPLEFEEDIKNDLLIKKISSVIPFGEVKELEKDTFLFPLQIQDQIQIKILAHKDIKPSVTQEELKSFWNQHKNQFQYPAITKIEYVLIRTDSQKPTLEELKQFYEETKAQHIDKNGNLQDFDQVKPKLLAQQQENMAENKALREYIALKKSKEKYAQEKTLNEGDTSLGIEVTKAIEQARVNETLKPIKTDVGFVVVKILEKKPKSTKDFVDAKEEALAKLLAQKTQDLLIRKAQELVQKGFEGENLGYITQESKIKHLTSEENQTFLNQVFTSASKQGYVSLQNKIILFKVTQQKLQTLKNLTTKINQMIRFYKGQVISKEFYKYLQNQYRITTFKKEG